MVNATRVFGLLCVPIASTSLSFFFFFSLYFFFNFHLLSFNTPVYLFMYIEACIAVRHYSRGEYIKYIKF